MKTVSVLCSPSRSPSTARGRAERRVILSSFSPPCDAAKRGAADNDRRGKARQWRAVLDFLWR